MEEENQSGEQINSRPWLYKKGQSGNPAGRPKGISLKEYAKIKFAHMTDEEKEEYFNGIDKKTIWEMAEGKAMQKNETEVSGNLTINRISFDDYDSSSQPEIKQD